MNKHFMHKEMQKVNYNPEKCIILRQVAEMRMRTNQKNSTHLTVVFLAGPRTEEVPARHVLGAQHTLFHLISNTMS